MTLDALPEWLRIMRFSRVVGKDKSEGSAREYYSARCEIDYSDSNLQRMLSAFYRDVDDGGRNDMIKKQHTSSPAAPYPYTDCTPFRKFHFENLVSEYSLRKFQIGNLVSEILIRNNSRSVKTCVGAVD